MTRKRHIRIRGEKVPVERRTIPHEGYAYKRTKSDKRPVRRRIVINRRLRGVRELSTLVHEAIHQLHIGLAESTVLMLEEAIVELILENPEIFHKLWEGKK